MTSVLMPSKKLNPLINTNKQINKNNVLKVLKVNNLSNSSTEIVLIESS